MSKCQYCLKRVNNKRLKDIDNDNESFIELCHTSGWNMMIHVELDAKDEDGYKASDFFKINYCPICRKKARGEK